jgi:hypothetical protein
MGDECRQRASCPGKAVAAVVEVTAQRYRLIDSSIGDPIVVGKRMTVWPRRMPDFRRITAPV